MNPWASNNLCFRAWNITGYLRSIGGECLHPWHGQRPWQTVMPSFPVAFHWSRPWQWQSSLPWLCSLFLCSIGSTWRGQQSVGLNLCLSAHSGDICDLLLVDSSHFLLTTGLCVSQAAKSSQLYAIRLQNAGDAHPALQSIMCRFTRLKHPAKLLLLNFIWQPVNPIITAIWHILCKVWPRNLNIYLGKLKSQYQWNHC